MLIREVPSTGNDMTINFETEVSEEILREIFADLPLESTAGKVAEAVLDRTECPYEAQINLLLTDDEAIHEMNMRFRGIDRATDVLSFPMLSYPAPGDFSFLEDEENVDADCFDPESGELLLGDIVISTDHCRDQAVSYGHSVEREYAFLIAHSMLHLCGYDHESVQEEKEMFSLQEEILERLGILR